MILLTHTSLDSIIVFTQRLEKIVGNVNISIVQYTANDSKDILYEKLFSGFKHQGNIGIVV